jgi:hypothetical protein
MKHKLEFFLFNRVKTAFLLFFIFSDIIPDRMPDNDVIIGLAKHPTAANDVIMGLALL